MLALPAALSAIIPHQVRRADNPNPSSKAFDSIFGNTEEAVAKAVMKADDKALMPFEGPHSLRGCVIYSQTGFQIVIFCTDGKKYTNTGDVGGELIVQLREGTSNTERQRSPILFAYDLNPQKTPPPAKPRGESTGVEEDTARAAKSRFRFLAPEYNNYFMQAPLPRPTFTPMKEGWRITFTFSWVQFLDRIPFAEGKPPLSWRLIVTYTDSRGEISSWGKLDNPVVLNWARGGDAFIGALHRACLYTESFGPAYKEERSYFESTWTAHRKEKYIGYYNPGKPTFETKNPESSEEFYKCFGEPLIKANQNLEDNTYFNVREGPAAPKASKLQKAFVDDIFLNAKRLIFACDFFEMARRDYLLAKFAGRNVYPPQEKVEKKPKKTGKGAFGVMGDLSLDELESDTADNKLDLDDLNF